MVNTSYQSEEDSQQREITTSGSIDPKSEITSYGSLDPTSGVGGNFYAKSTDEGIDVPSRDQVVKDPEDLETETRVFKSRYWILMLFSLLSLFHVLQWNNWGPISESVIAALPGWDAGTVAMMANWGTITFLIFILPICWLNERYGLRVSMLTCAFLLAAGSLLRCIFVNTETFTILAHIGAFLIGIPGTLVLAAPPAIAATWFPPQERITATAFSQVFCQLGGAGSYLEPFIVRSPGPDVSLEDLRSDIMRLMYIGGAVGVALLIATIAYFPAHPPLPPSVSSSVERFNLMASVKEMVKIPSVWLMMVSYGLSEGVCVMWITVLDFSLLPLNIHMAQAMWIGVVGVLASCIAGLVAGRLTDKAFGHMKLSLIVLELCALACYFWFFLLTRGTLPISTWQVYTSVALGMSFSFAAVPLYFELTVELAFPCPEVLVGGFLATGENIVGVVFLLLFFIKGIGYTWVVFALMGACAGSILPILFVKEVYKRSNLDRHLSDK